MSEKPGDVGLQGFETAPVSETVAALMDKYLRQTRDDVRRETRYSLWTNVRLWPVDSGESECVSTDVSESGLGLFCRNYIPPGEAVQIGFTSLDKRLMVTGIVRHSLYLDGSFYHVGIEFVRS